MTHAERKLLDFADIDNPKRGQFTVAGTSDKPLDPTNDPAHADEWPHDRDVRAELIEWLAADGRVAPRVHPNGIRVLGARVTGQLNLSHIHVPFAVVLQRCAIVDLINLEAAEVPAIDLGGSYVKAILAPNLVVHGNLDFAGVNAAGPIYLSYAKIDGFANFGGGHFRYSDRVPDLTQGLKVALYLSNSEIKGDINLYQRFESLGCVFVAENVVGGDFNCWGGRFINPGNTALLAGGNDIKGGVFLGPNLGFAAETEGFEADGLVMFDFAHVMNFFIVNHAEFKGRPGESHGFSAPGLSVRGAFLWQDVRLENGAIENLTGANVGTLLVEDKSWPESGKLIIDGLSYSSLTRSLSSNSALNRVDARSGLRWLGLQPGFQPQPYRQLAKVLEEGGDETGAMKVRIAAEDLRFAQYGMVGRAWGAFLKDTVGYGHRPLRTIMWSLLVVLIGWAVVRAAKAAALMRPTYPENAPAGSERRYERLYPFLYSLDVFLPFVNLHQEHYWWPDADASGQWRIFGMSVNLCGTLVLYYLWAQIIAGWILSAIFVAGVTGLIRND